MANSTATTADNLRTARDRWVTAYLAMLADMTTDGAKPTYSVGGQSVSWAELYEKGPQVVESLTKAINALGWSSGGPVDTYRRA